MAEGRGGSRWTEVIELADEIDTADHRASGDGMGNLKIQEACGRLREIARSVPVGEPDASQKTINGLLDAVERLNGQKDALRCENGQLRELLDLPVGERVAAVAELVGEPERAESHCSCGWSGSFAEAKAHRAHHRAAALAEPVESTDDERLRARAAEAMAEADDKMLPDQTYRRLARAAVAAVRAAGVEESDGD